MKIDQPKLTNCVCRVVKEIADRQLQVMKRECHGCNTFIQELTSNTSNLNTIPLLFVCKDCDYFIGTGIFREPNTMNFRCIETPVFRVSKVDEDTCCAEIELLQPQTAAGTVPPFTTSNGVCRFFPLNLIQRFIRTGICITIDLNCFCGVECLPAVNAERGTPQEPPDVCVNPVLTLNAPAEIICTGTVTGSVTCNGEPVAFAVVFLTSDPSGIVTIESPVLTGADGNFTANVTVPEDTDPTDIEITATTTVNGIIASDTVTTEVSCPGGAEACGGCRIQLGIQNADADAVVTTPNGVELLSGDINVNVLSCSQNCNTQPDNFNFQFRSGTGQNTTTINFIQGRRSTVICDPEAQTVTLSGSAEVAQGPGTNPFPTNRDFTVTIEFVAPNMWNIIATDGLGNVFETTFTGIPNQQVIEDCNT